MIFFFLSSKSIVASNTNTDQMLEIHKLQNRCVKQMGFLRILLSLYKNLMQFFMTVSVRQRNYVSDRGVAVPYIVFSNDNIEI